MKLDKDVLTTDEVRSLVSQCNQRCLTGLRNAILISLLYETGLRIGEALALRPKDLNVEDGTIRILHGKGDRSRTIHLPETLVPRIELWLERRKTERGINKRAPVFCTIRKGPSETSKKGLALNDIYVRELIHRLARKADIGKRVHPHCLRRSFASQLIRQGVEIDRIQQLLGHSDLQTTGLYLRDINPKGAIQAAREMPSVFEEPEPESEPTIAELMSRIAQLEQRLGESVAPSDN
jgi:site-specific recombinase XerD